MASMKLVVVACPQFGEEAAFENWYGNIHLADTVAVEGFVHAQMFKRRSPVNDETATQYYIIYELDTDDPRGVEAEIERRIAAGQMTGIGTIEFDVLSAEIVDPISAVVYAPGRADSVPRRHALS